MEKITLNGVEQVEEQERHTIQSLLDAHSKSLHYLAFARQLYGNNPLNSWIKENSEIMDRQEQIINDLIEKKEVCSLYPQERLTLYPIEKDNSSQGYHADLSNNDKNFDLILHYNDDIYKTEYLVVDFGHLEFINQQDFDLIIVSLQNLLKKSKRLKGIYIECVYHIV